MTGDETQADQTRGDAWPEVKLIVSESNVAGVESWLFAAGALSVTLFDPTASDDPAVAVLEPVPDEVRLWKQVAVTGLFPRQLSEASLHAALQEAARASDIPLPEYHIDILADRIWEQVWLQHFRPLSFGRHLWIVPGGQSPVDTDAVNLKLDPGLAFGTGTHPTTALCLDWLGALDGDRSALAGRRVLDYGTGSGVLAIAALLLGADEVVAVDIDPQALVATRHNAERNEIGDRLQLLSVGETGGMELAGEEFDLLMANILFQPLMQLGEQFASLLTPESDLLLSGLLTTQVRPLTLRYNQWFDFQPCRERDGWALLRARRNQA